MYIEMINVLGTFKNNNNNKTSNMQKNYEITSKVTGNFN